MDDLISRQAAIEAVSRGCLEFRGIFAECEKNLNELPSAQPERKTGKWLELTNTNHTYVCSVCGRMLEKRGNEKLSILSLRCRYAKRRNRMMLFTERAELAEEVIQWMKENNVANTPLSVISYLEAKGWLRWKDGCWILCEERLPEDYTEVLVWFEYFRYGDYNCLYQTYGIGDYIASYGWMINHETGWHKLRVIAWMPMPEPYEEGNNE